MKKLLLTLIMLTVSCSLLAQEKVQKYGISLQAGYLLSTNGTYADSDSTSADLNELVNAGPAFGIGFLVNINRHHTVEMLFSMAWMNYKDGKNSTPDKSPTFSIPALVFNNYYYISGNKIRPYLMGGIGIYDWRFTEDGPFSDVQKVEGEKMQKMSIGGDIGLGLQLSLSSQFAVNITAKYHYILCKDEFFFGKGYSEQGLMSFDGGLVWYF